jgi:hypothetical protein
VNHAPIHYVIGLMALAFSVAAYNAPPTHTTVVTPVKQATSTGKINPYDWGEMEQVEVDALQKELEALPKKPVIMFCSDDNCRNMVLDLDNAFESAKWSTDIQRPFIDSSVGLWTSSKDIADAIDRATKGRLKASILGSEWKDQERIALAIGRKPR